MNKLFLLGMASIFTIAASTVDVNYRPYISTRMAKVIMTQEETPDDDNTELCDGSGWITHGDGHKTECPGCSACKDQTPNVEPKEEVCPCGCGKKGCKCQESGQCFPIEEAAVLDEPEYYIYHLGAKWCGPCVQMKEKTWKDSEVLELIEERDGKLKLWDIDIPSHKKFFDFYKVKLLPTIIIVKSDNLNEPIYRSSCFIGPEKMKQILEGNLENG